ncbi:hypothetical protein ACS0TY_004561 [Phlomoides rotata]
MDEEVAILATCGVLITMMLEIRAFVMFMTFGYLRLRRRRYLRKEIFGRDRANDESSQTFPDVVQSLLTKETQREPSTGFDQDPQTPPFNDGSQAEYQSQLWAESSSAAKSKGKKRKLYDETDERFIKAMNLFSEMTDSRFGEMIMQLGDLALRVGAGYECAKKRASVYEVLGQFQFLSLESRVHVSQYLCNNRNELDLFFSLPDDAKAVLVKKILNA